MNENAKKWAGWLQSQLDERGWKQADFVRASEGTVKRDRVSKWLSGKETPNFRSAVYVANTLEVDQGDVLRAAGFNEGMTIERQQDMHDLLGIAMSRDFTRRLQSQLGLFRELRLTDFSDEEIIQELARRLEGLREDRPEPQRPKTKS